MGITIDITKAKDIWKEKLEKQETRHQKIKMLDFIKDTRNFK